MTVLMNDDLKLKFETLTRRQLQWELRCLYQTWAPQAGKLDDLRMRWSKAEGSRVMLRNVHMVFYNSPPATYMVRGRLEVAQQAAERQLKLRGYTQGDWERDEFGRKFLDRDGQLIAYID